MNIQTCLALCVASVFLGTQTTHASPHRSINKIPTTQPLVALTFDDGPNQFTPKILDILKATGAKATFFEIGKNVTKNPDLSRRVSQEGHQIGNHSMTHPHLAKLSTEAEIRTEIDGFQHLIKETTGHDCTVFRAPFFSLDDRVWKILDEYALPSFIRTVGGDFKGDKNTLFKDPSVAQKHAQEVVEMIKKSGNGTIILMHERDITPYYLEAVIKGVQKAGFTFVTLSQLQAAAK